MKKVLILAAGVAALALPGLASAADLSGAWKLVVVVADMTVHVSCELKQSGADLSGTCGRTDEGAVEKPAAVTGQGAAWSYSISFQDMPLKLDYAGNVKSDTAMDARSPSPARTEPSRARRGNPDPPVRSPLPPRGGGQGGGPRGPFRFAAAEPPSSGTRSSQRRRRAR